VLRVAPFSSDQHATHTRDISSDTLGSSLPIECDSSTGRRVDRLIALRSDWRVVFASIWLATEAYPPCRVTQCVQVIVHAIRRHNPSLV